MLYHEGMEAILLTTCPRFRQYGVHVVLVIPFPVSGFFVSSTISHDSLLRFFLAGACACHYKMEPEVLQTVRLPRKMELEVHQILRLQQKVTV